jgi:hypothetical protein
VIEMGGRILFGRERQLGLWASRIETGLVEFETRVAGEDSALPEAESACGADLLPLTHHRQGFVAPYSDALAPRAGDEVAFAILRSRQSEVREALEAAGWHELADPRA